MSEQEISDAVQRRNVILGLALGGFVLLTVIIAVVNFYYLGLPKDANRMRERFQQRSAVEAQNLSQALNESSSTQDDSSSKSEDAK